jgi:two-component system, sensor histidine kinase and response regulator
MSGREGLRILLVEDNLANQLVAMAYLTRAGHSVEKAGTGLEAIDMFYARDFDLVLMDIQMPSIDGLECARMIRTGKRRADIPIIALTANALRRDRQKCLEAGMNGYFAKPIDWDALLEHIAELGKAA